jgi:CelD/BcsL family acetyltransferase involved in cellulose biosynthesis
MRTLLHSPYLELTSDWAEYEAGLPSALKSEVRRRRRRLAERGELAFDVTNGEGDLETLLDEGFAVEGSGWKHDQRTAIESSPRTSRFYRRLAHAAARRGSLRLAFLRLNGRCAAFALGLEEDNVYYMLKSGYDPALRQLGPGIVLRYELVSRAFAKGLTRYEFLGADEPWKRVFAQGTRERVELRAFPRSTRGFFEWSAAGHARPLARRLGLGRLRRRRGGRGQ